MFTVVTDNPGFNRAKLYQVIVDYERDDTTTVCIQYKLGYEDSNGNFISVGVNKLNFVDKAKFEDDDALVMTGFDITDVQEAVGITDDMKNIFRTLLMGKLNGTEVA